MFRLIVTKGTERKRRYVIREGRIVIGSAADAGIRLEDAGVDERHAEVTVEHGEALLSACGTAPVLLNGQSVTRTFLHHGDALALGAAELAFEVSSRHPWFAPRRMHHIQRIALAAVGMVILAELLFLGGLYLWRRGEYEVTRPEKKEPQTDEPAAVPPPDRETAPADAPPADAPEPAMPTDPTEAVPAAPAEPVEDASAPPAESPVSTAMGEIEAEAPASEPAPEEPPPATAERPEIAVNEPEPAPETEPEPEPRLTVIDGPGNAREQRAAPDATPEKPAPEAPRFMPSSPDDFMKQAAPYRKQLPRRIAIESVEPLVHMLETNRWMVTLHIELINRSGHMLSVSEDIDLRTGYYYTGAEDQTVVPAVQYIPDGQVNLRRNWKAGDARSMYRAHIPPFERELNYRGFIAAVYWRGELQDVWATDESLLDSDLLENSAER